MYYCTLYQVISITLLRRPRYQVLFLRFLSYRYSNLYKLSGGRYYRSPVLSAFAEPHCGYLIGRVAKSNERSQSTVQELPYGTIIACGSHHTLELWNDGMLLAFGFNDYDQLHVPKRTVHGIGVVDKLDNEKSVGPCDDS